EDHAADRHRCVSFCRPHAQGPPSNRPRALGLNLWACFPRSPEMRGFCGFGFALVTRRLPGSGRFGRPLPVSTPSLQGAKLNEIEKRRSSVDLETLRSWAPGAPRARNEGAGTGGATDARFLLPRGKRC